MSSGYQVAPIFLIRMAGPPFDLLDPLATSETARAARAVLTGQYQLTIAKTEVEAFLESRSHELTREQFRAWKKTIRSGTPPISEPNFDIFHTYRECASTLASAEAHLTECLQRELDKTRASLMESARIALPDYLVFADAAMATRMARQWSAAPPSPRNKQSRANERHLLLYVQRVCAKNDSLSEFGPCGWGRIDDQQQPILLTPMPGVARREVFLERWAAHTAAAALNADPGTRSEMSPRIHPNGRLDEDRFIFAGAGESVPLDTATSELLARCDGRTPAHSLGVDLSILEQLATQNLIRWDIEVPALEPHAFDVLLADIDRWRDTPVRTRWRETLHPLGALPHRFADERDSSARAEIMKEAGARLERLGTNRRTSDRFLYSATNPIGEECFRECGISVRPDFVGELTADAAPWIDLWRDNYAFIASRVAASLRGFFEKAAPRDGAIALPAFLRLCETANVSLTGPGLVALAAIAFHEVKLAFRERMKAHANKAEYALTKEDCQFIRQQFEYEKFDEYTYPSADVQLAAKSVEAVSAGDYQWILAELHPPVALLHHGFYWSCPDKPALGAALAQTVFGRPNFHYGFFAADFTATTAVRIFEMPDKLSNFVAPHRGNPGWRLVSPAESEVYVDQQTGDVCLRAIDSGEHLGSFARNWLIPLGFHPFSLPLGESSPRLRCGKVIVQRRSWTVRQEDLGQGDFTGISRDLVLAVERLRAERDWPRHIYIRPTENVLRRSGAEGRDKDTKPVFVDLESYLFLEIFHRWLTKAGELEITEMLPAPDDLLWREADGRRTFELRTQIIPRE